MQKPPSVMSHGSRLSLYSTTSSVRTSRVASRSTLQRRKNSISSPSWWGKPIVRTAWYTDLATGAWHAGLYSLFLSFWTFIMSVFDVYCLEEATPGSSHTGYYWISYEFVYVGNHHIRNILVFASLISIAGSVALFVTSCVLLNALRLENQTGFVGWLMTMTVFTSWKVIHLGYSSLVNDLIFGYHIFTFFSWLLFSTVSIMYILIVYSMYHEFRNLSKMEDMTRYKMDVTSRAGSVYGSVYGSRANTPYNVGTLPSQYSGASNSRFGTLQSANGIYSATPAYINNDSNSLYTSTPRQHQDHLYASLQRGEDQIYSTIIN